MTPGPLLTLQSSFFYPFAHVFTTPLQTTKATGYGMLVKGMGFGFKQTCSICSSTIPPALRVGKSLGFSKPQLPRATEHDCGS